MSEGLGDGAALEAPAPEVEGPRGGHGKVRSPCGGVGSGEAGRLKGGEAFSPAAREKGAEEMCWSLSGRVLCMPLESAFRSVLPPFGSAFQERVISSSQVPPAVGASLINAGKVKLLTPICVGREISACSSKD